MSKNNLSLIIPLAVVFTFLFVFYSPTPNFTFMDMFWGEDFSPNENITNIIFGDDPNEGNVTIDGFLFVSDGIAITNGSISTNASCTFLGSPDGSNVFEVCNNNSFHMVEDGIRYFDFDNLEGIFGVPLIVNATVTANKLVGDGSQITNLTINTSQLNISSVWTQNGNDIEYTTGNVSFGNITFSPNEPALENHYLVLNNQSQVEYQHLDLELLTDYKYVNETAGGTVSVMGGTAHLAEIEGFFETGEYRLQTYVEVKTSQANKRVQLTVEIDDVEVLNTGTRESFSDEFFSLNNFISNVTLNSSEHHIHILLKNVDNTVMTWRRGQTEIMLIRLNETNSNP